MYKTEQLRLTFFLFNIVQHVDAWMMFGPQARHDLFGCMDDVGFTGAVVGNENLVI